MTWDVFLEEVRVNLHLPLVHGENEANGELIQGHSVRRKREQKQARAAVLKKKRVFPLLSFLSFLLLSCFLPVHGKAASVVAVHSHLESLFLHVST